LGVGLPVALTLYVEVTPTIPVAPLGSVSLGLVPVEELPTIGKGDAPTGVGVATGNGDAATGVVTTGGGGAITGLLVLVVVMLFASPR
jgi:hypothetical protein